MERNLGKNLRLVCLGYFETNHSFKREFTGVSLVNMGRAHCKIATLQETFTMTFEDTFLGSIRRTEDEIKEYQVQRKKLESRRCVFALSVLDFASILFS